MAKIAVFALLESSKLISRKIWMIEKGQSWKNCVWHPLKWRRRSLPFGLFFGPLVIPMLLPIDEIYFFVGGPKFRFCTCKKEAAEAFYGLKNNFTMLWKFCTRNILLQDLKTAVTARLQLDLDFFSSKQILSKNMQRFLLDSKWVNA